MTNATSRRIAMIINAMARDERVAVAMRNHERIGSEATKKTLAEECEVWRRERSPFAEHRAAVTTPDGASRSATPGAEGGTPEAPGGPHE